MSAEATPLTDDDLRLAIDGDHDATQRIVRLWYRKVYAHCRAKLISPVDAEDATQETFLRAWRQLAQLQSVASLGGWLRGISHHVCVDQIRRNQIRKAEPNDAQQLPDDHLASPQHLVNDREQQRKIADSVAQLPESLREVIWLHYFNEMTYDEIAEWLGVARSTVNDRLSRARQMLKTQLSHDGVQR